MELKITKENNLRECNHFISHSRLIIKTKPRKKAENRIRNVITVQLDNPDSNLVKIPALPKAIEETIICAIEVLFLTLISPIPPVK